MPRPHSVPVAFLTWTVRAGRAKEMAEVFDGKAVVVYPQWAAGFTPFRYLVSLPLSIARLAWNRPQAVIATNPPVFSALSAWIYCAVTRKPFVMDAHPVAFGAKSNVAGQLMLPLTRFLARRARLTAVTTQSWVDEVEKWGAQSSELHEAPTEEDLKAPEVDVTEDTDRSRPKIFYVGIFGGDEPIDAVISAARACPDYEVIITGDLARAPEGVVESAPDNVTFCGYLNSSDYRTALVGSTVVTSFTTEPTSVMRAAYEAVYAHKPLVITDTPGSDVVFPHAIRVANEAEAIAAGWRSAIERLAELRKVAPDARDLQLSRWNLQRDRLQLALKP